MARKKAAPKTTSKAKAKVKAKVYHGPALGERIDDFQFHSTQGDGSVGNLRGQSVVLYFYPKDSTSGCTLEGRDFARLHKEFKKAGAILFGVSRDSLASHEKFRGKEGFPFHLISDVEEELCRQFDVIQMKNMYGKKVRGIERSTFVIDPQGRLVQEWRKVSVAGHADAVLAAVQALK